MINSLEIHTEWSHIFEYIEIIAISLFTVLPKILIKSPKNLTSLTSWILFVYFSKWYLDCLYFPPGVEWVLCCDEVGWEEYSGRAKVSQTILRQSIQ